MALFVLGMHRSGTSMVASILQSLGVNLGPDKEMVPANQFNTAGYFENAPSVAANDVFLKKNDLSWRTLPAIDTRTALLGIDEYTAAIREIVKSLDTKNPWCLKDPRLSFLLPYWTAAAKPASAIICLRRPDAAALSLKTRNDLSVSYSAALWELYTIAALRNTRDMPRAVVVYEELLAKPKDTIEKLIAALPELAKLKPGADAIKAAVARVRRDLDHSQPVNNKAMPPAVLDLYERIAKGDLSITSEDTAVGVASELVRLEAGHQTAKRLNNEAREQLARVTEQLAAQKAAFARHTERAGDIVGLTALSGEARLTDPDAVLERLRQVVRKAPGPGEQSLSEEAARELVRAKDDRIEWLRSELGATGARSQAFLDKTATLEVEVVRLRAEHEQQALIAAANRREVVRLGAEVQRLNELLTKAEENRASLQVERTRVKSEYDITLAKLAAERGIVADTMESLRVRLEEKEALVARIQSERLEDEATTAPLKRIAGERESLLADLSRATQMLEQRNRELTDLGARERDLNQRAHKLDADIERLQRDVQQSRMREVELASTLSARDQSENALRAAVSQQSATAAEMQLQLLAARETIELLETTLAQRTQLAVELEAQHVAHRGLLTEYEVRIPILEAAAVERAQLSSRNSELKAEIVRIIAERDKTLEKNRNAAAALESQVAELKKRQSELAAEAQQTARQRDQALAAIAERDASIQGQAAEVSALKAAVQKHEEARAAIEEKNAAMEAFAKAAEEREDLAVQALAQKESMIERLKKSSEERDEVARRALRDQDAIIEGLRQAVSEAESLAAHRAAEDSRAHALALQVEDLAKKLGEAEASQMEAANAKREASELREQLALAMAQANTAAGDEGRLKVEHEELARALQSARDRAEQLKAELAAKATAAQPAKTPSPSDQRLRRQLLVLNELLQSIDTLLSPKYGRFAIPVRQIRVRLTQARQVVDGEVAMTRR